MRFASFVAVLAFSSGRLLCLPAGDGSADSGRAPLAVTVEWLSSHLEDSELVLLHVGDRAEYDAGHIPGAHFIRVQDISTGSDHFPPLEMPPVSQLQDAFERLGAGDSSRIVVYFGKDWVAPAARVLLILEYLGLGERCSLLDGGMPAWRAAGKQISAESTEPVRGHLTPRVKPDVVVGLDWVRTRLNQPEIALVDARAPNFFKGESAGSAARAGHIPGAVNIPFASVVDESLKLKGKDALVSLFREAGVKPAQTVVTYCHIGQQASLVYLVARYLGYEARMYDGSFTEWSSKPDLPVASAKE